LKATTDQLLEDHVQDHVGKKAIIFTDFATQAEGKVSEWAKEALARLKDEEGIERGEAMTFVGDDGDMKKWCAMNRFSKPLELGSTDRGCHILVGTKAVEAGISSKDLIFGLCVAPLLFLLGLVCSPSVFLFFPSSVSYSLDPCPVVHAHSYERLGERILRVCWKQLGLAIRNSLFSDNDDESRTAQR
jgi:hypothetical protein